VQRGAAGPPRTAPDTAPRRRAAPCNGPPGRRLGQRPRARHRARSRGPRRRTAAAGCVRSGRPRPVAESPSTSPRCTAQRAAVGLPRSGLSGARQRSGPPGDQRLLAFGPAGAFGRPPVPRCAVQRPAARGTIANVPTPPFAVPSHGAGPPRAGLADSPLRRAHRAAPRPPEPAGRRYHPGPGSLPGTTSSLAVARVLAPHRPPAPRRDTPRGSRRRTTAACSAAAFVAAHSLGRSARRRRATPGESRHTITTPRCAAQRPPPADAPRRRAVTPRCAGQHLNIAALRRATPPPADAPRRRRPWGGPRAAPGSAKPLGPSGRVAAAGRLPRAAAGSGVL